MRRRHADPDGPAGLTVISRRRRSSKHPIPDRWWCGFPASRMTSRLHPDAGVLPFEPSRRRRAGLPRFDRLTTG